MYKVESCIRGFHVYRAVWTPYIGEQLDCALDSGNSEDPFAVAVQKDGETIGHVPRTISCVSSLFLRRRGAISCTVTGNRRRSNDLPQGGLEVPCVLRFTGPEELVEKVTKRLEEIGSRVSRCSATTNVEEGKTGRRESCTGGDADVAEDKIGRGESGTGDEADVAEGETGRGESGTGGETDVTGDKTGQGELCTSVQPMRCSESLQKCQLKPAALEQKAKNFVVKVEKKDDELLFSNDTTLWLRFEDIILTMNDKQIIESGMCLMDQHINFAQRLLRRQFPNLNGLQLTLLQDKPHCQPTVNALQILHIKKCHWIVAFTKNKGKLVYVYDSTYSSVDQAAAKTIQTNFHCSMLSIRLMKSQKQVGAEDCGLFAIASATSLAFGEDPSTREYCQAKMRTHLVKCFVNEHFELFP